MTERLFVRPLTDYGAIRLEHSAPASFGIDAVSRLGRMDSLRIEPGPGVPAGLTIPAADLTERFARSSGPGGQSVNTTDTKVQLSIDLAATEALSPTQRDRVLQNLESRLDGTVLTVTASEQRSQLRNRKAARERMASMIRSALAPATPRRKTKPSRASVRRRLDAKHQRSAVKAMRRRVRPGEGD